MTWHDKPRLVLERKYLSKFVTESLWFGAEVQSYIPVITLTQQISAPLFADDSAYSRDGAVLGLRWLAAGANWTFSAPAASP